MKNLITSLLAIVLIVLYKVMSNNSQEQRIFNTLIASKISVGLALLIVAQSKHETAVAGVPFSSRQCLLNNNFFGYGYVVKNSFQVPGGGGKHKEDSGIYAKYDSLENSVKDVAGWYNRRSAAFSHVVTPADLAAALKQQKYFTDLEKNYLAGLTKFYTKNLS